MTATLDRISNGRLLINVVTGGDPVENKGDGIFLRHDERYEVTREFLDVYSDAAGRRDRRLSRASIFAIEDGRLLFPPVQAPHPPLYFGGSSDAGTRSRPSTVDKYLTWGEPPAQVAEKIDARARAGRRRAGRKLRFGIRLHVIVRETDEEAWARRRRADQPRRRRHRSPRRRRSSRGWIRSASSAWRSCTAAGATSWRSARTCGPASAWCAAAPARRWSAIAETVAERMRRVSGASASIRFILSGYPHLEEAYRFAELVFPLLVARQPGNVAPQPRQHRAVRRDHRQRASAGRTSRRRNHERSSTSAASRASAAARRCG